MADRDLLATTAGLATDFLASLPDRPVFPSADSRTLRAGIDSRLPEDGLPPPQVIEELARGADPGVVGTAGPRYFGFVIGGHHPVALAADWLTSTWDQNAGLYVGGPSLSIIEAIAADWLVDLFGLSRVPDRTVSAGFTTGCMMANFTGLAAGRHAVLQREGWDVESDGLFGAPPIDVVVGDEAHTTIFVALQYLGLGRTRVHRVAADEQGRMRADDLATTLGRCTGPTIVCAQAGNVNTGSFDPFESVVQLVRERRNAWLHVDGAFGLWAAASPDLRPLVAGIEGADSWATDAHKWLNVPYDAGVVLCADPTAHKAAMTTTAAYLIQGVGAERDYLDWVPEFSRRARGVPVYAALRSLGRSGTRELVDRCCRLARRMAAALAAAEGVEILNDVVLNQVLVRFEASDGGDSDTFTRRVIAAVQTDRTCWLSGTVWHGRAAMRISVSNWSTTEADIDRSAEAILRSAREVRGAPSVALQSR